MPRNRVVNRVFARFLGKNQPGSPATSLGYTQPVTTESLAEIFADCDDYTVTPVFIGGRRSLEAAVCYVDGLVQGVSLSEDVMRPLTEPARFDKACDLRSAIDVMLHGGVYNHRIKKSDDINDVVSDMINGFCAVVFNSLRVAVTFEVKTTDKRAIGEPTVEKAVKGAKDAFVEMLRTNTGLLRRKMRSPDLKIKQFTVGKRSLTTVAVVHIEGLSDPDIVREVQRRIDAINVDGLVSLGNIEDSLVERSLTPFPQLIYTERVDKFCMNLLEGRVGVMVDGFPIAYVLPASFSQFIKVPEDKSDHFLAASMLTALRYIAACITLVLPGFYVAVAMYSPEMMPTKLMLSIIESKQNVPFSTATEVISMLIAFEVLQEAGLRLPQSIGETVSIIGALVVGQSAVEAKVVSAVVVIVVAVSGICGYTMPNQDMAVALRIWRFVIVLAAVLGGMFGVAVACTALTHHLAGIENFGVAYISPLSPVDRAGCGRRKKR